jgi:hypothetical protein
MCLLCHYNKLHSNENIYFDEPNDSSGMCCLAIFMDRNNTIEDHVFDTGSFVNTLKQQKPNIVKPGGTMHYGTTGNQFGFGTHPTFYD